VTIIDVGTAASAAEIAWALTYSVFAFGFGFILGTQIKLVRKIEDSV
jgi:uncharacterized membrane protein